MQIYFGVHGKQMPTTDVDLTKRAKMLDRDRTTLADLCELRKNGGFPGPACKDDLLTPSDLSLARSLMATLKEMDWVFANRGRLQPRDAGQEGPPVVSQGRVVEFAASFFSLTEPVRVRAILEAIRADQAPSSLPKPAFPQPGPYVLFLERRTNAFKRT